MSDATAQAAPGGSGHEHQLEAVLCSHNAHKALELQQLLPQLELRALAPGDDLPEETGDTFLDNARLKARAGARLRPGAVAIADDSGLCVDALDGAPGVRSARFAGAEATDAANTALLLERLADRAGADERRAKFVCVLVALLPDGREVVAEGAVHGTIAREPRGEHGFGYDPVFVPEGEQQTFGELGPQVKQRLSHRAAAARALAARLEAARHGELRGSAGSAPAR